MNKIKVLSLYGTKYEMGQQYGRVLKDDLRNTYDILVEFFTSAKIGIDAMIAKSEDFYQRYPYHYQKFILGIAEGSGIDLQRLKILNGMETIHSLIRKQEEIAGCAFISIPSKLTHGGSTLIGRNYDFPPPFGEIAKLLTITILNEYDAIPTAFISMPGQIYCPTCINKNGIFLELNNGMPSGGYHVNVERESLLINLLESLSNSENLAQLKRQLSALESDYSLIINAADQNESVTFEYSSNGEHKVFSPNSEKEYVSTNFYLSDAWENIPEPNDEATWYGVTRRNNIMNLIKDLALNTNNKITIDDMLLAMDLDIRNGGALWESTIYQIAYNNGELYIKKNTESDQWNYIPLDRVFDEGCYTEFEYLECFDFKFLSTEDQLDTLL